MYKYTIYTLIASASITSVVFAAMLIKDETNLAYFHLIDKLIIICLSLVISFGVIKIIK